MRCRKNYWLSWRKLKKEKLYYWPVRKENFSSTFEPSMPSFTKYGSNNDLIWLLQDPWKEDISSIVLVKLISLSSLHNATISNLCNIKCTSVFIYYWGISPRVSATFFVLISMVGIQNMRQFHIIHPFISTFIPSYGVLVSAELFPCNLYLHLVQSY